MGKDDKVYNENEIKERLKKELPLWIFEGNWINGKKNGLHKKWNRDGEDWYFRNKDGTRKTKFWVKSEKFLFAE